MKPFRIPELSPEQRAELDTLYRTTRDARLRTRAQMILLSAEQGLTAPAIASIVREDESTVLRWLKRFAAEGCEGLKDAPRAGRPAGADDTYCQKLLEVVRRRPRSLDQPFSLWTLQRLADHLAETTGTRVSHETVRRRLKDADIVLSRPQHTISSPDPEYLVKKRRLKKPATG
jgi:transposase